MHETRTHTATTPTELLHTLITAVSVGFILSFRDWGTTEVDINMGLTSLIISSAIAFAVILLRIWAQRRIALRLGYFTKYTIGKYTLPISIFLAFFTQGLLPYVSGGQMRIKESKRLRLGAFRHGLNYGDLALIGLAAPMVSVILMLLIKPIYLVSQDFFIQKILIVNAALAFFGLIPIRGAEGFDLFYYRRWLWVMVVVFVSVYFSLILLAGVFSYVIAFIMAIIGLIIFQTYIDK